MKTFVAPNLSSSIALYVSLSFSGKVSQYGGMILVCPHPMATVETKTARKNQASTSGYRS